MGLMDKVTGFVRGEEAEDDFDDEFSVETEEVDEELGEDEFGDDEWEDEVAEVREWDSAYQFSDEAIQGRGFSGMGEFIPKAMVHRINRSPMYRDRVAVGRETMKMVDETMGVVDGINGDSGTEYGELAKELEDANALIDQVEKFDDSEERMVHEITTAVSELAGAVAGGGGQGSMDADVNTQVSREEL